MDVNGLAVLVRPPAKAAGFQQTAWSEQKWGNRWGSGSAGTNWATDQSQVEKPSNESSWQEKFQNWQQKQDSQQKENWQQKQDWPPKQDSQQKENWQQKQDWQQKQNWQQKQDWQQKQNWQQKQWWVRPATPPNEATTVPSSRPFPVPLLAGRTVPHPQQLLEASPAKLSKPWRLLAAESAPPKAATLDDAKPESISEVLTPPPKAAAMGAAQPKAAPKMQQEPCALVPTSKAGPEPPPEHWETPESKRQRLESGGALGALALITTFGQQELRSALAALGTAEALKEKRTIPRLTRIIRDKFLPNLGADNVFEQLTKVFNRAKFAAHRQSLVFVAHELFHIKLGNGAVADDIPSDEWRKSCIKLFLLPIGKHVKSMAADERRPYCQLIKAWGRSGAGFANDEVESLKEAWDIID